jgi:hypothetical protein
MSNERKKRFGGSVVVAMSNDRKLFGGSAVTSRAAIEPVTTAQELILFAILKNARAGCHQSVDRCFLTAK